MSSEEQTESARSALITGSTQIRYLIVGGWNTLFGLALFAVLLWLLEDRVGYAWILLICQVVAVIQAHWAQRRFVWRSASPFWPSSCASPWSTSSPTS